MATITPKIGLKKPELTDTAGQTIADLQANFDKIDDLAAQHGSYTSGVSSFTPTSVKAALDALAGVRIVEMGSNSNGTYVRWENGLQVCWRTYSANLSISGSSSSLAHQSIVSVAKPVAFTSPSVDFVYPFYDGGTAGRVWCIGANWGGSSTAWNFAVAALEVVSGTKGFWLLAIGRWK